MREEDESNIQHGWADTEDRYELKPIEDRIENEIERIKRGQVFESTHRELAIQLEIAALRARVARLEEALQDIANGEYGTIGARRRARSALEEK